LLEVIGCTLSVSGCRKYGAVVILENFQPSRDVGRVFFPRLLLRFEIGTQKSRSQLGNEFFAAVTFIAPTLAPEVTVKSVRLFRPIRGLMLSWNLC
jgi:hypothetical protein